MPNYFSMHSPTTLPMSRHQIQARCCQMFHLNHLIGQTQSSHLTKLSQQGPTMIEDQLWLTIIEGIISPTQTCKNPGPQASWLNRPQSRSRCQWRPPLPRPDQASVTIISKTSVLCFIIYLTSYLVIFLFSLLDLEILSAELQYKIEKYKLEMINLQQNIKRCKDTANQKITLKREKSLYSIIESIKRRSGSINSKVITALLKPNQLDLFDMRWASLLFSNLIVFQSIVI